MDEKKSGIFVTHILSCSGWVPKSAILPFSETISTFKISKRHSLPMIQEAMNEAKTILDAMDDNAKHFYDRMYGHLR